MAQWDPTVKAVTKLTPVSVYDHSGRAAERRHAAAGRGRRVLAVGRPVRRGDALRHHRHAAAGADQGGQRHAIAVGGGATWVSDTGNDVVSKIEGDSVVGNPIPTGAGPGAIAVADRAVWVAERFATRSRASTPAPTASPPKSASAPRRARWPSSATRCGSPTAATGPCRKSTRAPITSRAPAHRKQSRRAPAVDGRLWVSVQRRRPTSPHRAAASRASPSGTIPAALDPALALVSFANVQIANATCANLYNYADASGAAGARIIPEVASGMPSVSEDGSRYTITIRHGFRFSPPSGEPVTARPSATSSNAPCRRAGTRPPPIPATLPTSSVSRLTRAGTRATSRDSAPPAIA